MGACAAGVVIGGKVPVVITSRSDDAPARLASIAAAVVALKLINDLKNLDTYMTIKYLKKSPKTSSTDDLKTREIVQNTSK